MKKLNIEELAMVHGGAYYTHKMEIETPPAFETRVYDAAPYAPTSYNVDYLA